MSFRGTSADTPRLLALRRSGEVVYRNTDHQAAEPADDEPSDSPELPTGEAGAQPERGKQVSFTGRVGKVATITPKEGPITVKLAVAEHTTGEGGQEQTVWHEVWPSQRLAPKVVELVEAQTLTKGVEVSVRGYQHRHPPKGEQTEGRPFVRAFMISPT